MCIHIIILVSWGEVCYCQIIIVLLNKYQTFLHIFLKDWLWQLSIIKDLLIML